MADLNQRYALIGLGLLILALGSSGDLTNPFPNNTAVLLGTLGVVLSCASLDGPGYVSWNYFPVGGSGVVSISTGALVAPSLAQTYKVEATGSQPSNLIILNATMSTAGTYYCNQGASQAYAQLIIINSDPIVSMTPNALAKLVYNQTVQMSCNVSYTATAAYVAVDIVWSKGNPATVVTSSTPQYTTSGNLTTAVSTITERTEYSTPFPIYRCNTAFKMTGNPPSGSANNAPSYSKSTPLFSSPIPVIYVKPADAGSITGAKDGDQVYLGTTATCNVSANPPANYSWLDVTYGNTTNSPSIQIWHDGEFKCTASNEAGSTSASINVTTYITTTTSTTTTTTTPTTTFTSRSTSPTGSDSTAPSPAPVNGGMSETNKIIIGVVVGVGGALVIAAVIVLICCCHKKKNKADRYSAGGSEGTLSKPPPYDDNNGHRGPQRSSNPDLVQMGDYKNQSLSPYSTAGELDRPSFIHDDGLNYAQIQLDNNPRSRQPLQVAEETNYSDVRIA